MTSPLAVPIRVRTSSETSTLLLSIRSLEAPALDGSRITHDRTAPACPERRESSGSSRNQILWSSGMPNRHLA